MNDIEKIDIYKIKVKEALKQNPYMIIGNLTLDETSHIENIAFSICAAREKIFSAGGFVSAILDNDLEAACARADETCIKALKFFVYVKSYVYC